MQAARNDYVTHKDLETFGTSLHRSIVDDLSEVIAGLAQNMHSELAEVRKEMADIRSSLDNTPLPLMAS